MNRNQTTRAPGDLAGGSAAAFLDSLALIEVSGDDARDFLQGQFSNDLEELSEPGEPKAPGHAAPPLPCQLTAYCNPKGRVLALIRLVRHAGGWWMLVPAELAESLVARLKMFVLRARVEIALMPRALLGLIGDGAHRHNLGRVACVTVGGGIPRHILIGDRQSIDHFARAGALAPEADDSRWRLADILSGIAQVYPPTAGQFIPQMLNLDLAGGLSFTKGCYPGQEIVARLRYRGRVKQRMIAGVARGLDALAPGDPVYSGHGDGHKAGLIVDAVPTNPSRGEYTFSATAPAPPGEIETLQVGPGAAITRIALPYQADESAAE